MRTRRGRSSSSRWRGRDWASTATTRAVSGTALAPGLHDRVVPLGVPAASIAVADLLP